MLEPILPRLRGIELAVSIFVNSRRSLCVCLVCVFGLIVGARSEAQQGIVDAFDHYRSGFPLEGRHALLECAACHRNAVFKGTPRQCAQCHDNIRAEGRNFRHIPTSSTCELCHTSLDWRTSRFDHTEVFAGCVRCHDNFLAPGKNAAHPPTDNVCENCHNAIHWNQILPDAPAALGATGSRP
jgi:hypothetical protein